MWFIYYLIFISLVSFFITCYDKFCAIKGMRRISERNLLTLSVLGGSVAMYITMHIIRHKTKYSKFMVGIPVIIIMQIIVLIFLVIKYVK